MTIYIYVNIKVPNKYISIININQLYQTTISLLSMVPKLCHFSLRQNIKSNTGDVAWFIIPTFCIQIEAGDFRQNMSTLVNFNGRFRNLPDLASWFHIFREMREKFGRPMHYLNTYLQPWVSLPQAKQLMATADRDQSLETIGPIGGWLQSHRDSPVNP